jgi:hypothetical protein
MHAEVLGNTVIPTSESIIDANRTPILLLKAAKAGIPTMPYIVTSSAKQITEKFNYPLAIFAVNPIIYDGYKIAKNRSGLYRALKSLGMNYKFAVCAQPLTGEMISFKSIFGKCQANEDLRRISEKVYQVFKIPLCKLHAQRTAENTYLCGLQPLRKEEISQFDLKMISEALSEMVKTGDSLVG